MSPGSGADQAVDGGAVAASYAVLGFGSRTYLGRVYFVPAPTAAITSAFVSGLSGFGG